MKFCRIPQTKKYLNKQEMKENKQMATNFPTLVIDKFNVPLRMQKTYGINVLEPYLCGFLTTQPLLVVVTDIARTLAETSTAGLRLTGAGCLHTVWVWLDANKTS